MIESHDPAKRWRLTGFYGHPKASQRKHSWQLLRRLSNQSNLPWLFIGDYNEILHISETEDRAPSLMRAFREALADCTLHDLGYMGHAFKWSNRRKAGREVREHLDRAAATASWCELFPLAVVKHLVASTSDHDPILLNSQGQPRVSRPQKKLFRFESLWLGIA